jgi:D-alanine transaminase
VATFARDVAPCAASDNTVVAAAARAPILDAVKVYLNGEILPAHQARIGVFDRGFLFGDGVYEGVRAFDGCLMSGQRHVHRFAAGLREARIDWDASDLEQMSRRLLEASGLRDAFIYWQVTRGTPGEGQPVRSRVATGPMTPTVFGYASRLPTLTDYAEPPRVRSRVVEDPRWKRGHLKSVSLLGNVLAAMEAVETGADDALMVTGDAGRGGGLVTEGCATNVLLALPGGEIATPSLDSVSILGGVTRARVLELAPEIVERPVGAAELAHAIEIILVGTTAMVSSVVELDGRPVGNGQPGLVARRLLSLLVDDCHEQIAARVGRAAAVA